ncbi:HAD family hydrolase [Neobacillus sp. SM06]|uniref:HAD family hydrolase n=1 Tax=Neobacillus sp. SM06 TaxID=3422492 RepID=UPI003D2B50E2
MIKTVLFDVDGVLLSEEHYFDASALTVWEMLISTNYLALSPEQYKTDFTESEIAEIRARVFKNDKVLKFLKSRGLNANWDMIYLTFSYQLIHLLAQIKETEQERIEQWLSQEMDRSTLLEVAQVLNNYEVEFDFDRFITDFEATTETKQGLMNHLDVLAKEKLGVETSIFKGKGSLWSVCEHVSQEWYVGDKNVLSSTGRPSVQLGKQGFLANETTLAPAEEISEFFQFFIEKGVSIGIGTGRPELETIQPFEHLEWLQYFDTNHIVTADEVLKAQKEVSGSISLSKPHPFTYLLALAGKNQDAAECLKQPLPLENGDEILIVGDSLADLLAARQMGCQFAAVLTGLSGKDARSEFEKHQADSIFDSVLDVKELIESIS